MTEPHTISSQRLLAGSLRVCTVALMLVGATITVAGQRIPPPSTPPQRANRPAPAAVAPVISTAVPGDYTIGAEDVLGIIVWREPDMSVDATVRPDGKISLPLINEVAATGLTPDELRARLVDAAKQFVENPSVTVVVRQINSRRVFITGNVGRPGPYPLGGQTTVLQLIAIAGGLGEYADRQGVRIMRFDNGASIALPFNYEDIARGKNLQQNIVLRPGDTVLVP
jgi:polysaccharide export outer membrane protein